MTTETATKSWPTLYKKTSNGLKQEWSIWVEGPTIFTRWGKTGGVLQTGKETAKPKNVGRSNATTAEQQALAEADATWRKKLKSSGYVQGAEDAMAGAKDASVGGGVGGGIDPMLAHVWEDHGHKMKWPCYCQPKLDGHRMIATVIDGRCTLWSRKREQITSLGHITEAIERLAVAAGISNFTLDGEGYGHGVPFEKIASFIRNPKPQPGVEQIVYHVYDFPSSEDGFGLRWSALCNLFLSLGPETAVELVETRTVTTVEELNAACDRYIEDGFEGAMARGAEGPYVGKRSYQLLKVKRWASDEFAIVGWSEGEGKHEGSLGALDLDLRNGQTSEVGSGFSDALRDELWAARETLKGKMVEVKFSRYTSENKLWHPTFLRLRPDKDNA